MDVLKQYKAKSDNQSVYSHNLDLKDILNQLQLNKKDIKTMNKIIKYHDVGKVVDSFQNGMSNRHRKVRHEMLSASLVCLNDIERLAILTHHKSIDDIIERFLTYQDEYKEELLEMEKKLGLKTVNITKFAIKLRRNKKLTTNKDAIKYAGLLNYCDHLGSSNIKNINKGFDVGDRFLFENYTSVQRQAMNTGEDILISAGTGSGKTEASLFWANNVDRDKDKRIFYILPYTASINAMYSRLQDNDISSGMLHSKALYFLYKDLDNNHIKSRQKYQSFRYFTENITVSTIHQIFKAMFNCKFNEMMLSTYQDSIFIIDEIHCYDERQLALILSTLKYLKNNYNIHICIMSASIPTILLNLIQTELDISKKLTLSRNENDKIKRHTVHYRDKFIESSIGDIMNRYNNGEKVMVVVNTVQKSQDMYREINKFVNNEDIKLLHSAFNQRDRKRIERDLSDCKVLVGTQAVEVSLDIDYDVMFTELSPIDSQIQRWGRINRKRVKDLKNRKDIFVYKDDSRIYDEGLISRTRQLLESIDDVDENLICNYLDSVYTDGFKDYDEYKDICESIFDEIQVGKWDSNYNEIISFTGKSVLPEKFIQEYEEFIENKKYHEANSLLVSISEGKYRFAKYKNAIDKNDYIHYNYDSSIGLEFGKYENIF